MPFRGLAPNMVILGVLAVVQPEAGISAVWTVFHAVTVTRAQIVVFGQFFVLRLAWVDSYQGSRPLPPPNDPCSRPAGSPSTSHPYFARKNPVLLSGRQICGTSVPPGTGTLWGVLRVYG